MKLRTFVSLIALVVFISAAFTELPKSPDDLFPSESEVPRWLINIAWVPNLDDPENIEHMVMLRDGRGYWSPTHADESQIVNFQYKVEEKRGKNKYALKLTFEDGKTTTAPFTHKEGRFKVKHPQGVVVFKHKISFKKAPVGNSAKVFYAHPERRG